jgi:hypothetical protein
MSEGVASAPRRHVGGQPSRPSILRSHRCHLAGIGSLPATADGRVASRCRRLRVVLRAKLASVNDEWRAGLEAEEAQWAGGAATGEEGHQDSRVTARTAA